MPKHMGYKGENFSSFVASILGNICRRLIHMKTLFSLNIDYVDITCHLIMNLLVWPSYMKRVLWHILHITRYRQKYLKKVCVWESLNQTNSRVYTSLKYISLYIFKYISQNIVFPNIFSYMLTSVYAPDVDESTKSTVEIDILCIFFSN